MQEVSWIFLLVMLLIRNSLDAPRIQPFEFPVQWNPGQKTTISCLSSGTPPLQFQWLKNNNPLQFDEDAKVIGDEDVSTLLFKKVGPRHGGNYTCSVKNAFGSDSFSARFNIPCEFIFVLEQIC